MHRTLKSKYVIILINSECTNISLTPSNKYNYRRHIIKSIFRNIMSPATPISSDIFEFNYLTCPKGHAIISVINL